MPSPFPGMDPYIETPKLWPDFLWNLAGEVRAGLNALIQPHYFARLEPREIDGGCATSEVRGTAVGVYLTRTQQLVTQIEILSSPEKCRHHEAQAEYLRRRQDLLSSPVHLLEIDLLREGERSPPEESVPCSPYRIVLSRADHRPRVEVWPIQLADRLPVLPLPLLEPDPDAPLDLGAAVASVYERGAYAAQIDYREPPPPPRLTPDEAAWLEELLGPVRRNVPGQEPRPGSAEP